MIPPNVGYLGKGDFAAMESGACWAMDSFLGGKKDG
jgi:hypothetical protein